MVLSNIKQPLFAAQCIAQKSLENQDLQAGLTCPSLFVLGEYDSGNQIDQLMSLSKALPNAEARLMSGAGHAPFLEDADEFNKILDEFVQNILRP